MKLIKLFMIDIIVLMHALSFRKNSFFLSSKGAVTVFAKVGLPTYIVECHCHGLGSLEVPQVNTFRDAHCSFCAS